MRIARRILLQVLGYGGVWLVLCLAIGVVAVEGALHPARILPQPEDEIRAQDVADRYHASLSDVAFTAPDGATLEGWSIKPSQANGDAVILLHGQSDNRTGMLGVADVLLRHGYAVLLPDARAHGASGGPIATYGVLEAGDLRQWVDWLEHSQAPRCVYGLGDSMGAAQLLQSLDTIPEFCAVVAESTFASFREAAYDRIGQEFHTGPWLGRTLLRPAVEEGLLYARWRYGVDLGQDSPVNSVASTHVPILLIHGLADTNLPPRHSELIKARNPAVDLWEPPHAGHCGAWQAEPEEYERRVVGWFESHDRASAAGSS
jgi:uncharacterized protein